MDKPNIFDAIWAISPYYFPGMWKMLTDTVRDMKKEPSRITRFVSIFVIGLIFVFGVTLFPIGLPIMAALYLKRQMIPDWEKENLENGRPEADH